MEISQLRYFTAVAEYGSIAKASKELNISTQGLSSSIRRLENELQVNLFYRSNGVLHLTKQAEEILSEATAALNHIDQISKISSAYSTNRTQISIAITRSKFMHMPVALQELLMSPPDEFSVEMIHDLSNKCVDMVLNDEVQLATVYGDYSNSDKFDSTLLENCKQVFIVNKDHPLAKKDCISLSDLNNIPMISPGSETVPGALINQIFENNGMKFNVRYSCLDPQFCIEKAKQTPHLVARALAVYLNESDLDDIKILNIPELDFPIPFSLISKKGRKLSVPEQLFKHMIIDCYHK